MLKSARRSLVTVAALLGVLVLGACSRSSKVTDPVDAGLVTVRGVVVSVTDQRPVDGGILLLVQPSAGPTVHLYVQSGMRPYVPGQDPNLIPTAESLVPGDTIEGRGKPGTDPVILTTLRRLSGR